MSTAEALAEINTRWAQECTCVLKKTATQAVFGAGNASARVVFIGEAPGKKEDLAGTPFIGAAGKFLDEMLASIDMDRADVYITNIVKYRPPENRDPEPSEKAACAQWLYEELVAIEPQLVVFLGRHAMNTFFPKLKISEVHGELIHAAVEMIPVSYFLPLYHPASALYNGGLRKTLLADFARIPQYLKEIRRAQK